MLDRSLSDVLPFGAPESAETGRQPADSRALLAACRDRLAQGVAAAFARNLGVAKDALLGMADRATTLEQQQIYFTAMEFLASRSEAFLRNFRSTYAAQFDSALAALRHSGPRQGAGAAAELSLIATDDFERDLAIGKHSARAACNCAQQLAGLDRQVAALLRLPRIAQDDNPLYPRAIFTAALIALNDMDVTDGLALTLLQELERRTSADLPGVYDGLNRYLTESGLLPPTPAGLPRLARRPEPIGEPVYPSEADGAALPVAPEPPLPVLAVCDDAPEPALTADDGIPEPSRTADDGRPELSLAAYAGIPAPSLAADDDIPAPSLPAYAEMSEPSLGVDAEIPELSLPADAEVPAPCLRVCAEVPEPSLTACPEVPIPSLTASVVTPVKSPTARDSAPAISPAAHRGTPEPPIEGREAAPCATAPHGRAQPPHNGGDVFAQLARAIEAAAAAQLAQPAVYFAQPRVHLAQPALPEAGLESGTALGLAQLVDALTGLQRGRSDARRFPGIEPIRIDPNHRDALQQIRATRLASWSHPVDALTIDIVAMLFDAIFDDPDLPQALCAEIAKLQIPVLKVALMDKAFFSNERHPARRLLDAIASAGIGRSASDETRPIATVAVIVDEVVDRFETDIEIFAVQVKKLEDFLCEEDARAQSRASRVAGKLAQRDRRELARARVETEIQARIRAGAVPALVADFLDRHWRPVLANAFVRGGDASAPWIQALETMDELLWSVAPKHGCEDRNRLLAKLPDLLKRLRTALESTGLNEVWDPFFAQLIRLHVGALHKEAPEDDDPPPAATRANPPPPPCDPSIPCAGLKTLELVDTPCAIEYHPGDGEAMLARPRVPTQRHPRPPQDLDVGAWVEFLSSRGHRKTLRLTWVSDHREVFLFTNRQGEKVLTLGGASLAEHLRHGRARVLSPDRITDRAVAQVLRNAGRESPRSPASRADSAQP